MNKAEVFEEKLTEFCFGGEKAYSSRRSYSSVAEMNDSNIGYGDETHRKAVVITHIAELQTHHGRFRETLH